MSGIPAPALAYGLNILEIIMREKEVGFNRLKELTGINTNSMTRYLTTLYELGYIVKTKDLKYAVGMKLCIFSDQINIYKILRERARPYLISLEKEFKITALLMGLSSQSIYCIDKVTSIDNVSMQEIGSVVKGNIFTPWGLLYLATLDDNRLSTVLNTTYKELFEELNKDIFWLSLQFAKENDYACNRLLSKKEDRSGIKRIAFPIYDSNGNLVASLAMGSFVAAIKSSEEKMIIAKMREYSRELSIWE